MENENGCTRRDFISKTAQGAAAVTVGTIGAPVILKASNPSDVIGIGIVGVGIRGEQLVKDILAVPNIQIRGVCEIYDRRLQDALNKCGNPKAKSFADYRWMLEEKDIDAVVFATPDHQHAIQIIDSCNAGKDVYCEKCMTHTIEEAKSAVKAVKSNDRVFQLGHQLRSRALNLRAKELVESGVLGPVTHVQAWHHRNSTTIHPWRYHLDENGNPPPDATEEHIQWEKFLMNAAKKPFDVYRFLNWRIYWEYGEGIAGDLQSHALDSVNQILNLGIPHSCAASGGIYYWDDGREIPDVWSAVFEYPEQKLQVNYSCILNNQRYGWGIEFFGKDASMRITGDLKIYAESVSPRYEKWFKEQKAKIANVASIISPDDIPVYVYSEEKMLSYASHMENFANCIRNRERTRCNEDEGFEEAVTALMSIISYKEQRRVVWDPIKQEVI